MDGLIVLIWQIMASDDGDEYADSDGGRPEKRIWWNRPMLVVMLKGLVQPMTPVMMLMVMLMVMITMAMMSMAMLLVMITMAMMNPSMLLVMIRAAMTWMRMSMANDDNNDADGDSADHGDDDGVSCCSSLL